MPAADEGGPAGNLRPAVRGDIQERTGGIPVKKPTMRDIAREVGTSAVTVSKAMAGKTGMSDEEYTEFYDKHKNDSWTDYDDQELANELIRAYAENIKSTVRGAKRAYTEYYGSKVKRVNSTFAYSVDPYEKIENPLEFLNRTELTEGEQNAHKIGYEEVKPVAERTGFLRNFSFEHDVPMLIYGE